MTAGADRPGFGGQSSPACQAGAAGLFNPGVLQQQTAQPSRQLSSGIGLHSGNRVNMTFLPGAVGSGVVFRRADLEGKPEIEARVDNVTETNRSTTLGRGNTKVHTVEHILAAFTGRGVDNAIVELDANEPPIADGSAREYCRMIEEAGLAPQAEKRDPYTVTEPIELVMGETEMAMFPNDTFKITCTSADKQGRFTQFFSVEISPKTWLRDLSHARTFCFYEEIEYLIKNGLIKGGSLENAVVVRDDAVLTTEPLRYPNEFVRHKILDILGDLSLCGRPLCGHLIAVKPSHTANCELARLLTAQMRRPLLVAQAFAPPPVPQTDGTRGGGLLPGISLSDGDTLDVVQIMKILPASLPVPHAGPGDAHPWQQHHGLEKMSPSGERVNFFTGAFSRSPHPAGRSSTGGHRPGGGNHHPQAGGKHRQACLLHRRGQCQMAQTRPSRRHADD